MNEILTLYEGRGQLMDTDRVFLEDTIQGCAMILNDDGSVVWSFVNKANSSGEL